MRTDYGVITCAGCREKMSRIGTSGLKARLEAQLVWMAPLTAGMPAHTKGWQIIEDQWQKLLSFSPRTELMRMQLATMKKALEAAERGSVLTKEERINNFFKTNIGRFAWKDFTEGSPGKRVAITEKGREEVGKKTEQEGRGEKKKQIEFTFDTTTCTIQDKKEVEAKNLKERKEMNNKATAFVRDKTRITMENRHEFEAIVREVNKHLGGVK